MRTLIQQLWQETRCRGVWRSG